MPTLPQLSGRKTAQAFESLGWKVVRQKGSHIILIKNGQVATRPQRSRQGDFTQSNPFGRTDGI